MKRLFFLAAGMFAMGCEDYLFAGLLPGIADSLHTTVVAVAQGCGAFGLAYVLSIPLCAFLLSRNPVRNVLLTALAFFIAGNLGTLLSPNLELYLASRFVAGIGGGLFLPVAVAAGIQLVEQEARGRALSVMWGFNSAGAVVGVPLGLWLASRFGWQATVVLIIAMAAVPLFGIALGRQALRVDDAPPSLSAQFRLLLDPRVLAVVGVTLLTATGCLGLYSYITQVLADTANSSDVAFSLWSIGGLIGSTAVGFVLDRFGNPRLVMAVILSVLFLTILSIPFLREIPYLGFAPFLVWGAMGWGTVTPQQYNLIQIKPDLEAIAVALNSSAVSLGYVIGTALGGLALSGGLAASKLPYATALFVLSALFCQMLSLRAGPAKS